jgi:cyclic beta-1,2-glucan synthetase
MSSRIGLKLAQTFLHPFSRWFAENVWKRPLSPSQPLRAELFSEEQLARHAKSLAESHRVTVHRGKDHLLSRLDHNESVFRAFNRAALASDPGRRVVPAAEWLFDNFYLVEEHIQIGRRHLPKGYSQELPRLVDGPSAGLPRVYEIVLEYISHVDAQIDGAPLRSFVAAYQSITPLKLGELWAIPIMLRLGLIENLRRVTDLLAIARDERDLANHWVDRLQAVAETNASRLVIVVADMAKAELPVSSAFVAEFCQRLARQSPVMHLARSWLERRLVEHGLTIEQLVHQEGQLQAADQVSVSHSITSLRGLSSLDWKEFVEGQSVVEAALRTDPGEVYRTMDFATRDRYRHAVEHLARHGPCTEAEVAMEAIGLAGEAGRLNGTDDRTAHVGFYLVDAGHVQLGRRVRVRWPWRNGIERTIRRFPMAFYGGGIGGLAMIATVGFVRLVDLSEPSSAALVLLTLAVLLPASQLAVGLMNWLATLLVKPRLLPRLDFSEGISSDCRSIVVVPTLLTGSENVDRLIEALEIHYLSNRDANLHFALLTDFCDAPAEALPSDTPLLQRAQSGIEMLNQKYPPGKHGGFFLLHRPRRWNAGEGVWMGYERKRGKLAAFNGLLRGGSDDCFSLVVGDTSVLRGLQYVITLDTDTQLPRDSARLLVGTMAHRLNRPVFDGTSGIVTAGHGILQPRVGASLPTARRSWFVRLYAGDVGIDPYTREVSDVYQDLFHEGSFIGKGIYDVDAFERAMSGRFPENTVLSHDLLEGCHARAALVSDIELYEPFPSRYSVDAGRRHRWIRGDWQIAPWLGARVPSTAGPRLPTPLSAISQWKLFDNFRRSLVPASMLLFLLGCWLLLPAGAMLGTLAVLGIIALPGLLANTLAALNKPADLPWLLHLHGVAESGERQLGQVLLTITLLPYDVFLSLDAIARTLARMAVTHRHLMEWQTSGEAERQALSGPVGFYGKMWIAPAVGVGTGGLMVLLHPAEVPAVLPIIGLWLAAPWVAWWISRPLVGAPPKLSPKQLAFLHKTARKTWHYFEAFVTERENWLPPDNFQEVPAPVIASRTSPTNIGLALLANLGAHDLGYLSTGGLIRRTQNTFATLSCLERYRGHFYNWYDTHRLQPMLPLYVSSVDSGNLAGHLLTLGAGLRELADQPVYSPRIFTGSRDTAQVLEGLLGASQSLKQLIVSLAQSPSNLRTAHALLVRAVSESSTVRESTSKLSADAQDWAGTLLQNCTDHLEELEFLAPWLALDPSGDDARFDAGIAHLSRMPTLRELASPAPSTALAESAPAPSQCLRDAGARARERLVTIESFARRCDEMAAMDFTFLVDPTRELFVTGFNVAERRCDTGFYDLLASEARLASYVAIALGQVPQDQWFSMGRLLVATRGEPVLVSWSGSMFEYLMPMLVMPTYENTLLDHTCRAAVGRQISYGKLRGVPWGISESGYNLTDARSNYQYRAFGVPGLGLKRGLAEDLVIAPYASALALLVAPVAACENLQRLAAEGREGAYGFYEAVDYTPSRQPPGESSVTIRSFMVHHQGMSLVALVNILRDDPMPRRFLACPMLKATELLLQERLPKVAASMFAADLNLDTTPLIEAEGGSVMRIFKNPGPPVPEVHLLSNGRYHVVVTSAGGGYSRWRDLAITRWREDATRDCWGTFVYLRDVATGEIWSAAHQPTLRGSTGSEAIFTQSRAEFRQVQADFQIHTEISVSPEDDVELRRITITNTLPVARNIELTSYAEVVLAAQSADMAHPAFSNLFVQTEFLPQSSAVLCTRRARAPEEKPPWLMHLMKGPTGNSGETSCETDRSRFVGRGRGLASPAAMQSLGPLSNTVGSVLDPIVSLRRTISLRAHETVTVDLVFGAADNREAALAQVEKYHGPRMVDRAFDLAWTHNQVTLRHLNVTEAEAQLYGRLAGALVFADPARRSDPGVLRNNRRGQSGLWSFGISGDLPIILLRISDARKMDIVQQLVQAHSYWRLKGLPVELVIVNEDVSVYRQSLHDQITGLIASRNEAGMLDKPGGIFVRRLEQVQHEDLVLLQSVARIVLDDERGTLALQIAHRSVLDPVVPAFVPTRPPTTDPTQPAAQRELVFPNGLGGFTRDGHEYVISLNPGQTTPAPWVNVLANPTFGTVVSESGSAYTWVENSHEFRLTPWSNDPVQDTSGEAVYLRDEQTGQYWSPTPLPARGATPYVVRHGFGYTVFEHTEHGIASELWVYVAMDAPVKFTVLKLRNISGRPRRVSVTGYWEWVLGDLRSKSLLHVQTEVDLKSGALLARNFYNTEFPERIAFIDVNDGNRTVTGDRKEFIGRNGTLAHPAALSRARLSGCVGAGLDPCGAVQVTFDLAEGQERETSFRLGVGRNPADVESLIQRFRRQGAGRSALEGVWSYWNRTLGTVNVDTPDPAVNVMANGWLLYQTLSARLWGRTGFYQSGGAYGFRDQLQDVMALVHAEPALAREHLLRAAEHQFREGDVQHWWHPPTGRGVRTHFSDDYLWLPYVTCRYVATVADTGVLDERIGFLEARPVKPKEEAYYDLPNRAEESASLYQHCVRAIEHGLNFGAHGLPLMGCGDWNDGMNRVGNEGRGESVWLAFFLYDVLTQFSAVARKRGDQTFADRCVAQAQQLKENIERHAWDGQWYRRAWFDNGEPLGSRTNAECQIDSLPQSWSILSGAGQSDRSREAMESVDQRLVRRNAGLIQLFDPPFDKSALNPGYIKGYIPGVRENGGQYTHGAIWTAMAFAMMGENEHAWELFAMLNPVRHGATARKIATYKVEPYVVAADVYALPPHTGRGGWTWYTGSAGWMYRLLVETLLGVNREGDQLRLEPRMPQAWTRYKIHYRYGQTVYHITITRLPADAPETAQLSLDGTEIPGPLLPLRDDGQDHTVEFKTRRSMDSTSPSNGAPEPLAPKQVLR